MVSENIKWVKETKEEREQRRHEQHDRYIKSLKTRIQEWTQKKGYTSKMDAWCDKNIKECEIRLEKALREVE